MGFCLAPCGPIRCPPVCPFFFLVGLWFARFFGAGGLIPAGEKVLPAFLCPSYLAVCASRGGLAGSCVLAVAGSLSFGFSSASMGSQIVSVVGCAFRCLSRRLLRVPFPFCLLPPGFFPLSRSLGLPMVFVFLCWPRPASLCLPHRRVSILPCPAWAFCCSGSACLRYFQLLRAVANCFLLVPLGVAASCRCGFWLFVPFGSVLS